MEGSILKSTSELLKPGYIPFTGAVVVYNEEKHLKECLNSLKFCDELIVVDLGSTDRSPVIAKELGAELLKHPRVEVVEDMYGKIANFSSHDWIIFLDPDEILPEGIESDLRRIIETHPRAGMIEVPLQFYFKGKPLLTTIWGGDKYKRTICHRKRVVFTSKVHKGVSLRPGWESVKVPKRSHDYHIKHYWVDSYSQMFSKHLRYIKREGKDRYEMGKRFSWSYWVLATGYALKQSLIDFKGITGGIRGIFLSFFYMWYVGMSLLSLRRYEKSKRSSRKLGKV